MQFKHMTTQLLEFKNLAELDQKLASITLNNDIDSLETRNASYIKQRFSNYEIFWNKHIVPLTRRIENPQPTDPNEKIRLRDIISDEMEKITMAHYGVFLNIIQARNRLDAHPDLSSFEDFYTHLVTVYWLMERFIKKLERIVKSNINITNCYEFTLVNNFCNGIKEYRHTIVHRWIIGKLISVDGAIWVPKKDKVKEYDTWRKIYKNIPKDITKTNQNHINDSANKLGINKGYYVISSNTAVSACAPISAVNYPDNNFINNDFVEAKLQMESDIKELQELLNNLWKVILDKMEPLRQDSKYLELQGIKFTQ